MVTSGMDDQHRQWRTSMHRPILDETIPGLHCAHSPADSFIKVVRFLSATTDLRTDFPSDHYVLTSSDRGSTAVPLDLGFKLGEGEGEAGRWSEATQAGCISVQLLPPRLVPCGPLNWSPD